MNHIKTKIIGIIVLFIFSFNIGFGQLVSESFSYSDGNLVGNGNWVSFSGTAGEIQVGSGLITITDSDSEDARVTFTAQSSGTVYFGYDIKVSDPSSYTSTDFEYFSGFADGTAFENRVDVAAFSASGWKPGISNSASAAEATWASDLSYASTYRIVVGITISTGVSELWVDPSSSSSTKITGTGSQTITEIDAFYLRQSAATPNLSLTLDNLSISTDFDDAKTFPVSAVAEPTSISATVQSTSQIDLSWTDNSNSDNILLAWNSTSTFGTPTNGQTYSADDAISGGGTVLQYGTTESYSHSSLTGNTAYYYKAWSYDGSDYSSGATTDATTLKVEPTNHPTSFSASSSNLSIEITWTDAVTGSQAPDGYLILGETDASITDPIDGTAVSDDTDASGNAISKNVTHGSGGSYTFTGLTASTPWYFEIFPYTNSGSEIDYKTDGTIPAANATTGVAPSIPALIISEVTDPGDNANGRYVEIYNAESSSVDLTGWSLRRYANANLTSQDDVLSGSIAAGGIIVIAFEDATDFNTIYGVNPDFSNGSVVTGNGDDTYELFDGSNVVDIYGEVGQDGTGEDWEYENSRAVRSGVTSGNQTWTSSEWTITSADVADCTPGTLDNDQSLPVELSVWKATSNLGLVKLFWTTDSEIENQGYIIERSGGHLDKSWTEIASFTANPALLGQGSTATQSDYSYIDKQVKVGQTYSYCLSDVDYRGNVTQHAEISVIVKDAGYELKPSDVKLHEAFPNPFNPVVNLSFTLDNEAEALSLEIYDIQGALINTLSTGYHAIGTHDFNWDGTDNRGNIVSSGVYVIRLSAGPLAQIQRVTLLR